MTCCNSINRRRTRIEERNRLPPSAMKLLLLLTAAILTGTLAVKGITAIEVATHNLCMHETNVTVPHVCRVACAALSSSVLCYGRREPTEGDNSCTCGGTGQGHEPDYYAAPFLASTPRDCCLSGLGEERGGGGGGGGGGGCYRMNISAASAANGSSSSECFACVGEYACAFLRIYMQCMQPLQTQYLGLQIL